MDNETGTERELTSLISSEDGVVASGSRRACRPRPATEKRKLQNRESQRTYREKQKRIVEDLRKTAASSIPNVQTSPLSQRPLQAKPQSLGSGNVSIFGVNGEPSHGQVQETERIVGLDDLEASEIVFPGDTPHSLELQESWYADASNQSLSDGLSIPLIETSWDATSSLIFSTSATSTDSYMQLVNSRNQQYDSSLSSFFTDTASYSGSSAIQPNLIGPSNDHSISPWLGNMAIQPSPATPLSTGYNDSLSSYSQHMNINGPVFKSHNTTLNLLQVDDTLENRDLLRRALHQKHTIGSIFLAGLRSVSDPSPATEMSSGIYANHLSLRRLSTMQAYLSNANALSFHVPSLMHPNAPSPFHTPDITTIGAANSYIATLTTSFPPHLKPTPAQILHPHLPFIDLLPFPTLRERAITLANVTPPLIDLMQLKIDILNDGLVCWGGTKGKGGEGQPWDMRTWEAAGWFLKKWWILVGGESDEIREGSRWWRKLRGEEPTGWLVEEN